MWFCLSATRQDRRVQLSQERDIIWHIGLPNSRSYRVALTRIQELSKSRENLGDADTSKKHLEEQISDLTEQIHGSEGKLAVYECRPSATSGTSQATEQGISRERRAAVGV
ncbi:hypothetical protein JOM56_003016 [Amanita muscaria]